jgi:hypothetical protein
MSMVKMVLVLLNMDVRDEIRADIITESISPLSPAGMTSITRSG